LINIPNMQFSTDIFLWKNDVNYVFDAIL